MIIRDGIERMYGDEPEDCFYYLTLYNENYADAGDAARASRTASCAASTGTARRRATRDAPRADPRQRHRDARARSTRSRSSPSEYDVAADVWSATSYKLLREDALERRAVEPPAPDASDARVPYVTELLGEAEGPIVAVTDFMKVGARPDRPVRRRSRSSPLGTDGYGFSDTRAALRRHFEVDAPHIVVAVLDGLAAQATSSDEVVDEAIRRYDVDPERPDPRET